MSFIDDLLGNPNKKKKKNSVTYDPENDIRHLIYEVTHGYYGKLTYKNTDQYCTDANPDERREYDDGILKLTYEYINTFNSSDPNISKFNAYYNGVMVYPDNLANNNDWIYVLKEAYYKTKNYKNEWAKQAQIEKEASERYKKIERALGYLYFNKKYSSGYYDSKIRVYNIVDHPQTFETTYDGTEVIHNYTATIELADGTIVYDTGNNKGICHPGMWIDYLYNVAYQIEQERQEEVRLDYERRKALQLERKKQEEIQHRINTTPIDDSKFFM